MYWLPSLVLSFLKQFLDIQVRDGFLTLSVVLLGLFLVVSRLSLPDLESFPGHGQLSGQLVLPFLHGCFQYAPPFVGEGGVSRFRLKCKEGICHLLVRLLDLQVL